MLERHVCRVWSSQHNTEVPSVTTTCALVFGQAQHSPVPATTLFHTSSPIQCFPIPKIKSYLKKARFEDAEEIQDATEQLLASQKNEFQDCFHQWKQRWIV